MKVKNVVSIVLLLFVAASVVYLVAGESRSRSEQGQASSQAAVDEAKPKETEAVQATRTAGEPGPADDPIQAVETPAAPHHKLVAYYFHRTQRCRTCLTMEAYAQDALREGLADAFESGELEWRAVNVEEPQHEHFVKEYGLTASALVMVLLENGNQKQWKDSGRIWELVGDEWEFKQYVQDEALAYLESGS